MDRNSIASASSRASTTSLSARRAWIEIAVDSASGTLSDVALRKESVDRNGENFVNDTVCLSSLSARRAWIEIPAGCWRDARRVSLSARRAWIEILAYPDMIICTKSLSARRAWIEILMKCQVRKYSGRRSPQGERG